MSFAAKPTFEYEDSIDGPVCGLDEVGRGPLAGPVVAACVYIPGETRSHPFVSDLQDSKKLSKVKLKILNGLIHEHCIVGIAEHTPAEIDRMNILQASLSAMEKAFMRMIDDRARMMETISLSSRIPHASSQWHALVDGHMLPRNLPCPAQAIKKGDRISKSIAAASIVAKFYRDDIMIRLADQYPVYGWDSNVGYPAPAHLNAIQEYGITPHHRKSFAPVRNFLESRNAQKSA